MFLLMMPLPLLIIVMSIIMIRHIIPNLTNQLIKRLIGIDAFPPLLLLFPLFLFDHLVLQFSLRLELRNLLHGLVPQCSHGGVGVDRFQFLKDFLKVRYEVVVLVVELELLQLVLPGFGGVGVVALSSEGAE